MGYIDENYDIDRILEVEFDIGGQRRMTRVKEDRYKITLDGYKCTTT